VADDTVRLNTKEVSSFLRALKKAEPDIRKHLRERLRLVGAVVAEDAKSRVRPYSSSIPETIKVRVSGMNVSVVAGGGDNAIAGLFELGNQGGSSSSAATGRGVFRHPVFGDRDWWVDQPMHPYLSVALASHISEVDLAALAAVDATVSELVSNG
jgi:hypothetical protein